MIVVIPKPNKALYDFPKSFRLIVLLNTMGKLIEKVIGERLQFLTTSNDFIHPTVILQGLVTVSVPLALGMLSDINNLSILSLCIFNVFKLIVKIVDGGLYFIFSFHFYFTFLFFFF